jgi:hypothetical protein
MLSRKFTSLVSGIAFLVIALAALYRLVHWFPITIGGMQVYQVPTFFVFVISAALSLISFQGLRQERDDRD